MEKIGLTYGGEIKGLINVTENKTFEVNYTIDLETGKTTTTSILINEFGKGFLMITFNYQDLKKLVESRLKEGDKNDNNR